jgi:hypothetical protein
VADTQEAKPPFWQRAWSRLKDIPGRTFLWLLLPLAALAVALGAILFRGIREARRWKTDMNSRLKKSQPTDEGILIAKLNGLPYRLGKLGKFKSVHVGSDASNAIRVLDKSIAGRHVRLYKDSNNLMVKNLAKSPIVANNAEIKAGRSHRLVLPSVIKLNERTKLNLILERHKVDSQENSNQRNSENGKR